MHSNEFTGDTLADVVRKATEVYGQRKQHGVNPDQERRRREEERNQRRCNDLILQINSLQRQAGRISDKIEDLEKDAEELRNSAYVELSAAVLAALGTVVAAARAARIILRVIKYKNARRLTEDDLTQLLSACGYLGAGLLALHAARKIAKARQLARQAEALARSGRSVGESLLTVVRRYKQLGCGEDRPFTGVGT